MRPLFGSMSIDSGLFEEDAGILCDLGRKTQVGPDSKPIDCATFVLGRRSPRLRDIQSAALASRLEQANRRKPVHIVQISAPLRLASVSRDRPRLGGYLTITGPARSRTFCLPFPAFGRTPHSGLVFPGAARDRVEPMGSASVNSQACFEPGAAGRRWCRRWSGKTCGCEEIILCFSARQLVAVAGRSKRRSGRQSSPLFLPQRKPPSPRAKPTTETGRWGWGVGRRRFAAGLLHTESCALSSVGRASDF